MLLARLRVRQKLALLVLPLLLLVAAGAVPLVGGRIAAAGESSSTAATIQRAVRIGGLIQVLQQERLVSLGYLSTGDSRDRQARDRLVVRSAAVLDAAEQLAADYGRGDDQLSSVLRGVGYRAGLGGLRDQVLRREIGGAAVHTAYTDAIKSLIDLLALNSDADLRSPLGRRELTLDAIIRHDEATSAAASALFIEPGRRVTPQIVALVNAAMAVEDREERVFEPLTDPVTLGLYDQVEDGQSRQRVGAYLDRLVGNPDASIGIEVPVELLPKVESLTALGRLVETRIAAEADRSAAESARRDRLIAGLGVGVALLVLLVAVVLSVLTSRSIARPLRRLTLSADEVADVAQAELVRVADTEDAQAAVPRLRPVRVGTSDELGELAEAFNRVQRVAADLVERQVVGRRNVATMFGNVGRRTQNLVGRQLAMIDSLERNEQDPVLLERLYRLDHVSTRLRRNANSLVVLSGAPDQELSGQPLSVADTIRAALGEIEGFQRVRLLEAEPALLTPHITADVTLLLAELLENGTSFSPPHTEVEVAAHVLDSGDVLIRIVDHGLGMTAEQLADENARLVERERLDLAPTDVLGLFVVGRLSRRHGIRVGLLPTPGTGVTAEVLIPARQVVHADEARSPVVVGAPAVDGEVDPEPETRAAEPAGPRGWWDPAASRPAPAPRAPDLPPPDAAPGGPASPSPAAAPAGSVPVQPPRETGPAGMVRRVRGAQLPRTDPRSPEPTVAEPAEQPVPEDARRSIEDFEDGVRRAQQESAAGRDEDGRSGQDGSPAPAGPLLLAPGPPGATRALIEELESGVRRTLARLAELAGPEPVPFFDPAAPEPPEPAGQGAPAPAASAGDVPLRLDRAQPAPDASAGVDVPRRLDRSRPAPDGVDVPRRLDRARPAPDGVDVPRRLDRAWPVPVDGPAATDGPGTPGPVGPPAPAEPVGPVPVSRSERSGPVDAGADRSGPAAQEQSEPVESAPVRLKPVPSAPVPSAPVPSAPVRSEPVESAPVRSEPVRSEPVPSAPVRSEPVRSEPVPSEQAAQQEQSESVPSALVRSDGRPEPVDAGPDGPDGPAAPLGADDRVEPATPVGRAEPALPAAWTRPPPTATGDRTNGHQPTGSLPRPRRPVDAGAADPAAPIDGAALAALVRRVPGAQLPVGARAARPAAPAPPSDSVRDDAVQAAAREAEAARAMVELFEAGVERALHTGHEPGGTTEESAG